MCGICRWKLAAAAPAAGGGAALLGFCLLRPAGVGLGSFRGCLIGQTADPNQTVRLLRKTHPDQEFAMLRAGGKIHVAVTGLGEPP